MTTRMLSVSSTFLSLLTGAACLGSSTLALAQATTQMAVQTQVQTQVQAATQTPAQGSTQIHAQAQTSATPGAASATSATGAPVPRDDSLFRALGGEEGIHRFIGDLVDRAIKDPRIAHQFRETKPQGLKDSLSEQVCAVSGGPCVYQGAKMKPAHADMGITKAEFLALVEDLQDAMSAQGVPFSAQNRLLALLAPMHRDIIATP